MAFVTLTKPFQGHRALVLSHDKAIDLQRAMKHPEIATAAQKRFIRNVKHVYLGRTTTEKVLAEKQPDIQSHWSEVDLK